MEVMVGKYSKYRRVLNDRLLVATEEGLYFFECGDSEPEDSAPTQIVFWTSVLSPG